MSTTILDQLIDRLRAAAIYNRHDLAAPSVVLWTDGEGLWSRAIPLLHDALPELLVLAPEIADERTGPSTWLRYRLARGTWEHAPVVYLPGVARHAFRGAAGFPEVARHLFALQFQGQFWSQQNGKDWTPSAFLSSKEGGLGLDLARDRTTLEAVGAQLIQVLRASVASLAGRRLEAADLHGLAAGDPVGLLLEWMASGDGAHSDWSAETVESTTRWAALPTVTATAKPAWRPLADALIGNSLPEGFEPQYTGTGRNLTTQAFRHLLASHGLSWLEAASTGDPAGAAWTEIGTFDHDGHAQGARLAWRLDEELRAVALRVRDLLAAGWQRAVLVTDHGWLLLPGGLPKVDLPAHLTQSRWPRCAVPQPGAQHGFPELPWFWGGGHSVVYAPGVSAFKRSIELHARGA